MSESLASEAGRFWSRMTKVRSGKPGQGRVNILQALDDQRAGSSALHLPFGEAMRVGMVPIETRRFIGRYLHVVIEALSRLDERMNDLILPADRRDIVPWKWMLVALVHIMPLQALLVLVRRRRRASSSCPPCCRRC